MRSGRGARIVNDVSCLGNEELAEVAARHGAVLVLTHSRGPMTNMPGFSEWPDADYTDVVAEVRAELSDAAASAPLRGVRREHVWVDPGFGFSKNARHSFELLRRLDELASVGAVLVAGPGRKSFISSVDPSPATERLGGTIAACLMSVERGAKVLRVHDVREVRQALAVRKALGAATPLRVRRPMFGSLLDYFAGRNASSTSRVTSSTSRIVYYLVYRALLVLRGAPGRCRSASGFSWCSSSTSSRTSCTSSPSSVCWAPSFPARSSSSWSWCSRTTFAAA